MPLSAERHALIEEYRCSGTPMSRPPVEPESAPAPVAPPRIVATPEVASARVVATLRAVLAGECTPTMDVEHRRDGSVAIVMSEGVYAHLLADVRIATMRDRRVG